MCLCCSISSCLTFCFSGSEVSAVIRAITYHAHITGLAPGDYEVNVVQTSPDGTGFTTLTEHAKVS